MNDVVDMEPLRALAERAKNHHEHLVVRLALGLLNALDAMQELLDESNAARDGRDGYRAAAEQYRQERDEARTHLTHAGAELDCSAEDLAEEIRRLQQLANTHHANLVIARNHEALREKERDAWREMYESSEKALAELRASHEWLDKNGIDKETWNVAMHNLGEQRARAEKAERERDEALRKLEGVQVVEDYTYSGRGARRYDE